MDCRWRGWFRGFGRAVGFARRLIVVERLLLLLALGLLAAAERLRDQRVGQHELGLGHVLDRQHHVGGLARRRVVALDAREMAFGAEQLSAEPLAAFDRHRHLDLHEIAGVAFEIGLPHQRAVDAGRRQLQPVGAIDRIGASSTGDSAREHVSQSSIVMRAVGPLGHHLHGAAVGARHAHAHQPIAQAFQHGLDDRRRRAPPIPVRRSGAFRRLARLGSLDGLGHPSASVPRNPRIFARFFVRPAGPKGASG